MKTWIVVINRAEARIFEANSNSNAQGDITFVMKLENPKGRLKAIDINADRPGSSMGNGSTHRGLKEKAQGPVERVTEMWAKEIVEFLDLHRRKNDFEELNLIVEPHFLGIIRRCMHKDLQNMVSREIPKELRPATTEAVQSRLSQKMEEETVQVSL